MPTSLIDSLPDRVTGLVAAALQPANLAQLGALLLAAALAGATVPLARRARAGESARAPRPSRVRAMLWLSAPYVSSVLVLLCAHAVLATAGHDTRLVALALRLIGALIAIRSAMFLLFISFNPGHRWHALESRGALVVWFFVAMHLIGWLEAFIHYLDAVPILNAPRAEAPVTLWSILKSLVTVIVFVIVSAWAGRIIERRIAEVQALAPSTRIAVAKFSYALLIAFGVLFGLSASGFNLGALSFFGGALGLGLGFGLQSIAANFVSGFVLLMDKSIKPGDVISFTGTLGTTTEGFGWVQQLRGRYVVVRDRDGVETLVPNQNLITNQVINWSYSDRRVRLKLPVRISYADDPEEAMRVLIMATEGHARVLREPAPVARLMSFHDYGMDLELRFWIADPQEGVNNVRSDINRAIWRLFREHGITIPRAQMDLRLLDTAGRPRPAPGAVPTAGDGD